MQPRVNNDSSKRNEREAEEDLTTSIAPNKREITFDKSISMNEQFWIFQISILWKTF